MTRNEADPSDTTAAPTAEAMTIVEAAAFLRVTLRAVMRAVAQGELPVVPGTSPALIDRPRLMDGLRRTSRTSSMQQIEEESHDSR